MNAEKPMMMYPVPVIREFPNIEKFFSAIAYKLNGYQDHSFSYIAVKTEGIYFLLHGRVFLNAIMTQIPFTHFESEHIRAGHYALSELQLSAAELVTRLTSGSLSTPHGELRFSPNENGNFLARYDPFHEDGQSAQSRFDMLTIIGASAQPHMM